MRIIARLAALALMNGATAMAAEDDVMRQLAPTGRLRVGVAYAPAATPLFVVKDAAGDVRGVPRDLGALLARELGAPAEIIVAANTGELTEACKSGRIDIGFMPADDDRRKALDFSPPYFVIESTYLVGGSTDIKSLAEIDRSDVSVVGIAGSATARAASRTLKVAKLVLANSVDEAIAMMKAGTAQAFALTHDALPSLQKQLPGSRILDGAFQTTGVAIAVRKDRPAALAFITGFMENAKANGAVKRAFDDAGLSQLPVAP